MQKINKSVFNTLAFKNIRACRERSQERLEMDKLEVDDGMIIYHRDWRFKSAPITIAGATKKEGKRFIQRTLADGSGWAIRRVE